jgi:molybdate transport system substrate-binding protein
MRSLVRTLIAMLFILGGAVRIEAQGQQVRIAAAADLKFAMGELAGEFEKQTGTKVDVTYGSSGNFFSQIQGAV